MNHLRRALLQSGGMWALSTSFGLSTALRAQQVQQPAPPSPAAKQPPTDPYADAVFLDGAPPQPADIKAPDRVVHIELDAADSAILSTLAP